MDISAKITGIKYKVKFSDELKKVNLEDLDINKIPTSCIISDKKRTFALSKWVSPKRTRSYPYERVYNTLFITKKITVIPIVKDEGFEGDRDFIQWDTISLMSLLDVYVILAYYDNAEKHTTRKNKITNQQFDNEYIISKIKEIENYHSSALHWNLNEIKSNISDIINKTKTSYSRISGKLKIKMHNDSGLDNFQKQLTQDLNEFMQFSRGKAKGAQNREFKTIQPKESLQTLTKAKIIITNYLGGKYFLTVDEVSITKKQIAIIESKHSQSKKLPGKSDIKDGLLKMILFCNLSDITVNEVAMKHISVLQLTSSKINGEITTKSSQKELKLFYDKNKLNVNQIETIEKLIDESKSNNFSILIKKS